MLTRLLACLALITGLAATGAPANAAHALALALSVEVGNSTVEAPPGKTQRCETIARKGKLPAKADPTPGCKPCKPIVIYIPTVQFGPDRAFE